MPKRVTSGGAHLCGSAPGQHCSAETPQQWRYQSDFTGLGIEPETYRTLVFKQYANRSIYRNIPRKKDSYPVMKQLVNIVASSRVDL